MSQSAQALGEGFDPGRFTAAGPGGLGPEMSPPSKMKQADPLRDPSRRKALAWTGAVARSAERRVGKECGRTCRSRGSPVHSKKKTTTSTLISFWLSTTKKHHLYFIILYT